MQIEAKNMLNSTVSLRHCKSPGCASATLNTSSNRERVDNDTTVNV